MRAGRLDRTITLQTRTDTLDDAGTPTTTWTTLATLRAELRQNAAAEEMRAWGGSNELLEVFRTYFLDGVTTDCRVLFEGEAFDVVRIVEIGRRKGLDITVKRIAP